MGLLKNFVLINLVLVSFMQALPIPSSDAGPDLESFVKSLFSLDPFDSNQRRVMKRQHLILQHEIQNGSENGSKNIRGGYSQFEYIPSKNQRLVRIYDLSNLEGEKKSGAMRNLTKIINEKVPVYEDKAKIQEMELALLNKGIWAVCKWQFPLPYPLDNDEQCTQSELKFLLQR